MQYTYTLYRVGYTEKYFFTITERLTGKVAHTGATYDTLAEAEAAARDVTTELDARAARDEEAYLQSLQENPS